MPKICSKAERETKNGKHRNVNSHHLHGGYTHTRRQYGVIIVDALTSETLEPEEINCLVTDKYIGSEDSWDKCRLIVIDDKGTAMEISVTLKQYTEIEVNDTITVSKITTESKFFGTTHDYRFAQ